jgi:hydrogenase maturation protease
LLMRGRVVVIGVGDSGRGDDAVGPLVAEMLAASGVGGVIDAGRSPEIETWRVRELAPETVLFVDAADLGAAPGDAAILEPADLRSTGFDTHRAPLKLTMDYLSPSWDAPAGCWRSSPGMCGRTRQCARKSGSRRRDRRACLRMSLRRENAKPAKTRNKDILPFRAFALFGLSRLSPFRDLLGLSQERRICR